MASGEWRLFSSILALGFLGDWSSSYLNQACICYIKLTSHFTANYILKFLCDSLGLTDLNCKVKPTIEKQACVIKIHALSLSTALATARKVGQYPTCGNLYAFITYATIYSELTSPHATDRFDPNNMCLATGDWFSWDFTTCR